MRTSSCKITPLRSSGYTASHTDFVPGHGLLPICAPLLSRDCLSARNRTPLQKLCARSYHATSTLPVAPQMGPQTLAYAEDLSVIPSSPPGSCPMYRLQLQKPFSSSLLGSHTAPPGPRSRVVRGSAASFLGGRWTVHRTVASQRVLVRLRAGDQKPGRVWVWWGVGSSRTMLESNQQETVLNSRERFRVTMVTDMKWL